MKGTPRDARLAVVAILLAASMPFLPKPAPAAHIEHHMTRRPAPVVKTSRNHVEYHIDRMDGHLSTYLDADVTKSGEWEWKMYRPFPTKVKP